MLDFQRLCNDIPATSQIRGTGEVSMTMPMLNVALLKHAITIAKWSEIYKLLTKQERHAAVLHIYDLLSEGVDEKEARLQI